MTQSTEQVSQQMANSWMRLGEMEVNQQLNNECHTSTLLKLATSNTGQDSDVN